MNIKFSLNIQRIVLTLFILSNILNLFFDRGMTAGSALNETDQGNRFYIQMVNVFILGLMLMRLFNRGNDNFYIAYRKPLLLFLILTLAYIGANYIYPNINFNIGQYTRLVMNITTILYFNKLKSDSCLKLFFIIFIISFIVQICWKIILGEVFLSEQLNAGDTASIGLAFLLPLIFMFFKNRTSIILLLICMALTILSLRRTSILAIALALPFVWPYMKEHISNNMIFIGLALIVIGFVYAWDFIGDLLMYRFNELINGGETGSRGSGRDGFWLALWEDFFENGNWILGCGMGAIATFYYGQGWDFLPHAHNDFLEILYTFGCLGLFVWFWFLLSYYKFAKNKFFNNDMRSLIRAALILYLFTGFASGCILRYEFIPLGMSLGLLTNHNIKNLIES